MSIPYEQMQARVNQLLTLGGWSNSLTPPDLGFLTNFGVSQFIQETQTNQRQFTISTVANQAEYSLLSDLPNFPTAQYPLTDLKYYTVNDDALYSFNSAAPGSSWYLPQTTRQRLRQNNVQYRDVPPAVPTWWYQANDQSLGLYPPPSTSGTLILFSGNREMEQLQEAEDTLPWHDKYVEAVALYGAVYHGKTIARGEELKTLSRYINEATDLVAEFIQDSTDKEAALINRYVARPTQNYISAGTRYPFGWLWPGNVYTGPGNG